MHDCTHGAIEQRLDDGLSKCRAGAPTRHARRQALLCKASGILLSRQMQAPQCGCDNRRLHACQAAGHEPRLRSRSWGSADGKIVHVAENPHDEGLVPALFRGRVQLVRCMAMVRVAPRLPPPTSEPRNKSRWAKEIVQKKDAFQAPMKQLKFYSCICILVDQDLQLAGISADLPYLCHRL